MAVHSKCQLISLRTFYLYNNLSLCLQQYPYSDNCIGSQAMLTSALIFVLIIFSASSAPDWTKVNDLIYQAINNRVFPGASLSVANQTHLIYRKNFGYLTYANQIHDVPVTNQTKYEIASVTKIMATTFGIMNLVSSNLMKVTDLVSKYFPNYDTNQKGNTTIANLLTHNSGLPYDYPGPLPSTPNEILDFIIFAKPLFPVGTKYQYSNLGFLLLGKIVQIVAKKQFNAYFQQTKIFAGLNNTNYNPPQSEWYNIAPTNYDNEVRKRIVRGQPRERVVYFVGGVSGHTGLFTDGDDLIRFLRILLANGKLPEEPTRVLSETIIKQFTKRVQGLPYVNYFGLGFDTQCRGSKIQNCFGSEGSTGVMAWADTDKKIVYVLLNNNVHPDGNNNKINAFKPIISDAIMEALGY